MIVYNVTDVIPLQFERDRNGARVSGLTVTATVKNSQTNATLLASTTLPETPSGSGQYLYMWTPGLTGQVYCVASYSVNGTFFGSEYFIIDTASPGGRVV